jgi:hypothetical protein
MNMKYRIYKIDIDAVTSADKTGSKKYVVWGHCFPKVTSHSTHSSILAVCIGGRGRSGSNPQRIREGTKAV